ncbi:MAG: IclR family transcriptional regulator [Pigmentiphaga sp.]|uniref:IclR family transcriptional regulator n=1 Tax=Pigmentiphaga sp. TaxID=1977564 RepID=UPI0029A936C2|nr:IclR family transcriptional regulator [Pigmentiphaga sp.]MDX3907805.1 IclR family transcriptional regulator [Pigmentiphaga sp.]
MLTNPEERRSGARKIQSLEVGFRLVRAIEEAGRALSLKEVSERAGMARSNAHLYLSTFVDLGVLARNGSGHYLLGPYALQLGLAALKNSNVVDVTEGPMRGLQAATGHHVHLSIWGNYGPTIVKNVEGACAVPVPVRVGFVVPLRSSATGLVFLAHQPSGVTEPIAAKERAGSAPDRSLTERLAAVRQNGYAMTEAEFYAGCCALAAPIFDHTGHICAALAVLDLSARMAPAQRAKTLTLLKKAVQDTQVLLGYRAGPT